MDTVVRCVAPHSMSPSWKRRPWGRKCNQQCFLWCQDAFSCSYLIAASAKKLFQLPKTCLETMTSCFLQELWCEWALLAPWWYWRPRHGQVEEKTTHRWHRGAPFCLLGSLWWKPWCTLWGTAMASCQLSNLWTASVYVRVMKWELLPCLSAWVCLLRAKIFWTSF